MIQVELEVLLEHVVHVRGDVFGKGLLPVTVHIPPAFGCIAHGPWTHTQYSV